MIDDIEFISNVRTLATNGTLIELLRRIEETHTADWKASFDPVAREKFWYRVDAINELRFLIKGLTADDKVSEFNNRFRRAS